MACTRNNFKSGFLPTGVGLNHQQKTTSEHIFGNLNMVEVEFLLILPKKSPLLNASMSHADAHHYQLQKHDIMTALGCLEFL